MPTHWESSKRPLFVRTVVVNGTRHAILTQEDPFAQNTTLNNHHKPNRPDSGESSTSSSSDTINENSITVKGRTRATKDLQSCLIKLRVVLAEQDPRKLARDNKRQKQPTRGKKKRRKGEQEVLETEQKDETLEKQETLKQKYDRNNNIAVASFFTCERHHIPRYTIHQDGEEQVERITGNTPYLLPDQGYNSTSSTLGFTSDYDLPWNNISSENYFTRPFYNRLSERVLQWMDLSNRNKGPPPTKTEDKPATKQVGGKHHEARSEKTPRSHRSSSEDNTDEVRVDADVDTALSRVYPKFSQELNRLHVIKSAIPAKTDAYNTTELAESLSENFSQIVSIRSGKYAQKGEKRKTELIRQANVEEIIEVDSTVSSPLPTCQEYRKCRPLLRSSTLDQVRHASTSVINRLPWLQDYGKIISSHQRDYGKPQLHIFIPALPTQNQSVLQWSDTDSINSEGRIVEPRFYEYK